MLTSFLNICIQLMGTVLVTALGTAGTVPAMVLVLEGTGPATQPAAVAMVPVVMVLAATGSRAMVAALVATVLVLVLVLLLEVRALLGVTPLRDRAMVDTAVSPRTLPTTRLATVPTVDSKPHKAVKTAATSRTKQVITNRTPQWLMPVPSEAT